MISGKTRICGIIGDPVEHTMSPAMHNAAFARMGLDYCYVPFRVKPDNLAQAVAGIRALNIRGVNVTIPHKVSIIPLLDKLDRLAQRIGAVNTIVNNSGALSGYNTDAAGFLSALLSAGVEPRGKKVVILGAGGASRAITFVLAERGAHLVILNRLQEMDWAKDLARSLSQTFGEEVIARELTDSNVKESLHSAEVLINATSAGMSPNINETLVPAGWLKPSLVVFDAVYNPIKTRLLSDAEQAGATTISGLEMLVWQGALAFELWTEAKAPVALMKEEALQSLTGHEK